MGFSPRTDLAVECVSSRSLSHGITQNTRGENFCITEIIIENDADAKILGKPKGRYVTLQSNSLNGFGGDYRKMIAELADELEKFIPDGHIMVAGLGNSGITPDALGVYAADGVIATRHLKTEFSDDEFFSGLRPVSVLISGVIGRTGIETAEIIRSVAGNIKPDAIIAIDALACADMSRLGKTIQISDSGISPGSGVQNRRKELSYDTMGIPVIAIGVPTVMDMYTIIENFTGNKANPDIPNMMVTPKDIDKLIKHSAEIIAYSLNCALQPDLSFEDIEEMKR